MKPENCVPAENGEKKAFLSRMIKPALILSQSKSRSETVAKAGKPLEKSFKIAIFAINIRFVRNALAREGVVLPGTVYINVEGEGNSSSCAFGDF